MSDNSKIEWTEATWNPVTGCTKVSPGCDHCYAERVTERFHGKGSFNKVVLHEDRLDQPLRWRRPRRVFVNSMSDLFHDDIPDGFIAEVFATMALAEQHTFQVLTKRHGRMRSLLNSAQFKVEVQRHAILIADRRGLNTIWAARATDPADGPLRNVWLGVSVENQQWADIRIPALLATPAAVRWISAEPLLGPVDLTRIAFDRPQQSDMVLDAVGQRYGVPGAWQAPSAAKLDWVVVGGESGPGARPMHPDWARTLRDQCVASGAAYHFKQWGEWGPTDEAITAKDPRTVAMHPRGSLAMTVDNPFDPFRAEHPYWVALRRHGKKAAGRTLDGRTWDEYPAVSS